MIAAEEVQGGRMCTRPAGPQQEEDTTMSTPASFDTIATTIDADHHRTRLIVTLGIAALSAAALVTSLSLALGGETAAPRRSCAPSPPVATS